MPIWHLRQRPRPILKISILRLHGARRSHAIERPEQPAGHRRLAEHRQLISRLDELEGRYDSKFKVVFAAIRHLMEPPAAPRKKIGFEKTSARG